MSKIKFSDYITKTQYDDFSKTNYLVSDYSTLVCEKKERYCQPEELDYWKNKLDDSHCAVESIEYNKPEAEFGIAAKRTVRIRYIERKATIHVFSSSKQAYAFIRQHKDRLDKAEKAYNLMLEF